MSILQKLEIRYIIRGSVSIIPHDKYIEFFKSNTRVSKKIFVNDELKKFISLLDGKFTLKELIDIHMFNEKIILNFVEFLESNCIIQSIDFANIVENHPWNHVLNFIGDYHPFYEVMTKFNKLQNAWVVIIGLGAVGSWTTIQLAKSGIKNFVVIDNDKVEESNLNRSCFNYKDISKYKTDAVAELLVNINSSITIQKYNLSITNTKQINQILDKISSTNVIVINCADYPNVDVMAGFVHTSCIKRQIPYIISGGYNLHLTLIGPTIIPFKSACFKCIQKQLNYNDQIDDLIKSKKFEQSQRNIGNIAPLAIISSTFTVNETIKLFTDILPTMINRRGSINFFNEEVSYQNFLKMPTCEDCSKDCSIDNIDKFLEIFFIESETVESLKKIDKNSIIFNNSVNLLKEEIIQDLFNMNNDISNFNKIKYTNKNLSLQDQEVYEFLICNSFLKYLKV